jgi:catechol 2,3-dioxygenase-like lactoylglutathione lyase family enzyme
MIIIESIDHISLAVSDIEASIEFYRENLGFDLVEHISGSLEAHLQVGEIHLRLLQEGKVSKSNGYIAFYVDGDEDAIEEIEENGLEVISGPENIRNGKRIVIADPDGNKIALCSSIK